MVGGAAPSAVTARQNAILAAKPLMRIDASLQDRP